MVVVDWAPVLCLTAMTAAWYRSAYQLLRATTRPGRRPQLPARAGTPAARRQTVAAGTGWAHGLSSYDYWLKGVVQMVRMVVRRSAQRVALRRCCRSLHAASGASSAYWLAVAVCETLLVCLYVACNIDAQMCVALKGNGGAFGCTEA